MVHVWMTNDAILFHVALFATGSKLPLKTQRLLWTAAYKDASEHDHKELTKHSKLGGNPFEFQVFSAFVAELTSPQVVESLSRDTLEAKPSIRCREKNKHQHDHCQHNHHQLPKINFKTPKHCNHQREPRKSRRLRSMPPSMHSYLLTVSVHTKPLKITKPKQETWNWSESRWRFVLINFDNSDQVLVLSISFLYLYSREDSKNCWLLLSYTRLAPTIVTNGRIQSQ